MSILNGIANLGPAIGQFANTWAKETEDQTRASERLSLLNAARPVVAAPAPLEAPSAIDTSPKPAVLAQVIDAIYGQESGHGKNTSTSVTGARGGMQIQPATFQQYARPGEDIDNPAHNKAVGERIIEDLWRRSGGDPARVAVGYFSGPGNIAPPDSPTPWRRDAGDPNGMTTARYVQDVLKRIGLMPRSET